MSNILTQLQQERKRIYHEHLFPIRKKLQTTPYTDIEMEWLDELKYWQMEYDMITERMQALTLARDTY